MKTLSEIQATLENLLPDLQKRYSIVYLGIFGSYVRGEETAGSDVHILIEFSPNLRLGLLTFCEIENYLSDQLEIKVDLVEKIALKPQIGQQILQEVLSL
jgi:uncharacterized protein